MTFAKHREEAATFEVSFLNRINAGETISTPTVRVEQAVLYEWQDVSDAILDPASPAITGSAVQFALITAADATVQGPGTYRVVVTVETNQNQRLIGIVPLTVNA